MPRGGEAAEPVGQSLEAPPEVTGDERFPNPLAVRGQPERTAQERQPEAQAPRQDADHGATRAALSPAARAGAAATSDTEWRRLGDILCARGLITPDELRRALREQALSRKSLGEVLVAAGSISATQLSEALMEQQRSEIVMDGGLFSGLFQEISERQHVRRQERWAGVAPTGHDQHQQERRFEVEPSCSSPSSSEAESPPLESEPASEPPPTPVVRDYLCFLPPPAGRLITRTGALPELGDVLDFDRNEYEVMQTGRSPLPDDQRPCIYLRRRRQMAPCADSAATSG